MSSDPSTAVSEPPAEPAHAAARVLERPRAAAGATGVAAFARAAAILLAERRQVALLIAAATIVALSQLAEPVLFGRVVDKLARGESAVNLVAAWAGIGFAGIVAGVLVAVAADRTAHRQRLAAMGQAFERAITLPVSYHAERGSGAVVRIILAGADALFWLWLGLLREQISAVVGLLCLAPIAIAMDARLAAVLGIFAIVFVGLNVLVAWRTSGGQLAVERYHNEVFGRIGDVIGNVMVVQSYARLAAEMAAMSDLMARLLRAQYPVLTWWGMLTVLTRAAGTIAMVAIFAVGAALAAAGEVSVGEIVSFVAFAGLLIVKLEQFSSFAVRTAQQSPTIAGFFALLDQRAAIADAPDAVALAPVEGRIAYENVSFRFTGGLGVTGLTFAAAPGETLALVGPTGAGKTTALALLQRLHAPSEGHITLDGHDIRAVALATLRGAIAVVFQDAGLFNRSIAENIRVGRPEASDAEVERAARAAEAHDFIAAKPGGYGFVIGEGGQSLSGGERQRIAIARAILKDAPILILDEATSALDVETEARIKRALDRLRRGKTTFIIAHRLSTVVNADRILALDGGRIVEVGRFDDLVNAGGLFARLVAEGGFTRPVAGAAP
jgi:ATP-binding cassette subfamily B protein